MEHKCCSSTYERQGSKDIFYNTIYSYHGYYKICCIVNYLQAFHNIDRQLAIVLALDTYKDVNDFNLITIIYNNIPIIVSKSFKITKVEFNHINKVYKYKIINISDNIYLIGIINSLINSMNDKYNYLIEQNNILNNNNKELMHENSIYKQEIEFCNLYKPKYNYKEIKENKNELHKEYRRIYKLIKKY